jgi:hypothetical protein
MPEDMPQIESSLPSCRLGALVVVLVVFVALFGYAVHERSVAQQLAGSNDQTAATLKQTQLEIEALNARLDALGSSHQMTDARGSQVVHRARVVSSHRAKPDPRWKKFQTQLDAQGNAIDSTRQDLTSTRTELQSSIAKSHEEIVALQRKGERNYYEFDVNKSTQFSHTGPIGLSLRKANTKHQYADLALLVDDREVSKKHLNLYEPAVFYTETSGQPLEVVVNTITKNHIHGYISEPKYRASELAAVTSGDLNAEASKVGTPQLQRR